MVEAVRRGGSQRRVARAFGKSRSTLQWWLRRVAGRPLDQVDWSDGSSRPHRVANRTHPETELAIIACRNRLKESSSLGFYGAEAIREALLHEDFVNGVPHVRTIGRILARNGILDGRRPVRRTAPPPGWYLPRVALGQVELESFDVIEGLSLDGCGEVDVLTGRALWGPQTIAWPVSALNAKRVIDRLLDHWQTNGLPTYAQFDNDSRFGGPANSPGTVGQVSRFCLSLGVTPVFAPPRETGFQAAIESFNGLWQAKVWERFHGEGVSLLRAASDRFIAAYIQRLAPRCERAPYRRAFPRDWKLNLQARLAGRIIYLRRTDDSGTAFFLGQRFAIDPGWVYRLVRCEVDITRNEVRCYRLRRREPKVQPLIRAVAYHVPRRRLMLD